MVSQQEILSAITEHLVGRGIEGDRIKPQASLSQDLDLDSLDTVELTLGLEERFSIEIPDSELEQLRTVQDAIDLIGSKLSVGA